MRLQKFSSPAREKRLLRSLKIVDKHSFAEGRKSATLCVSTARNRSTRFAPRSANSLLNTPAAPVHQALLPACKRVVPLFDQSRLQMNLSYFQALVLITDPPGSMSSRLLFVGSCFSRACAAQAS